MSPKLPALHEGHAPITLQQAFHEALETIADSPGNGSGQFISVDGHNFTVIEVMAAMAGCTDLVPIRTHDVLSELARRIDAPSTSGLKTYGDWVELVHRYCREQASLGQRRTYA